jgi:hypothetical protein
MLEQIVVQGWSRCSRDNGHLGRTGNPASLCRTAEKWHAFDLTVALASTFAKFANSVLTSNITIAHASSALSF